MLAAFISARNLSDICSPITWRQYTQPIITVITAKVEYNFLCNNLSHLENQEENIYSLSNVILLFVFSRVSTSMQRLRQNQAAAHLITSVIFHERQTDPLAGHGRLIKALKRTVRLVSLALKFPVCCPAGRTQRSLEWKTSTSLHRPTKESQADRKKRDSKRLMALSLKGEQNLVTTVEVNKNPTQPMYSLCLQH